MKLDLNVSQKITIKPKYLKIKAGVRYWEDGEVNGLVDTNGDLIPCRKDNYWCPIIDLDSGKIINWEIGTIADVHYKVCDDIESELLNSKNLKIASIDYAIPSPICESCDYIVLKINHNGFIQNWDNTSLDEDQWEIETSFLSEFFS